MKVLLYHMRYDPDPTGTAPLVTQLAQDLANKDLKVVVVSSLPHYGRTTIHPQYRDYKGFFHRSWEAGVEIIRTPVFVPRSPRLLPRALNYLSYNLLSVMAGFTVREVDVVLAINPPITTAFSAWIAGILHRAPLIVGIQDIWPDCVIQVGKISNRIVIAFSKLLEKIQYRISKRIVVLSGGMKTNLKEKGVQAKKIAVIANWADLDEVVPGQKKNQFYQEQGLNGLFTVLFSGNHGYIAALESVIETAELLQHKSDILFLLAGEGSVKSELVRVVEQKGLKNIRFLPTQPKERWLEMLAAVDVGLVTLRKELADLNVPSKVYTLMSASKPILASVPEGSEITRLIHEANCGYTLPPEDPKSLADAVLTCQAERNNLDSLGRNGRKYLRSNLHRAIQTGRYLQLILEIGSKDRSL